MESITYIKNIKIPPKKLRWWLLNIKKLSPLSALDYLMYEPNKAARLYHQAIKSAIASAKQTLKVTDDLLQFRLLTIEQGHILKRYRPGSRGSPKPYKHRFSHIKIILTAKETVKPVLKVAEKKVIKEEVKKIVEKKVKTVKPDKAKVTSKK